MAVLPTYIREIDIQIFLELDDCTLQSMYSVSKYSKSILEDDYFWKSRIKKNYKLDKIGIYAAKYKDIYLNLSQYKSFDELFIYVSSAGYIEIVHSIFICEHIQPYSHNEALVQSAESGHLDICNLILSSLNNNLLPKYINLALIGAVQSDNLGIVKLLFNLSDIKTHILSLIYASGYGHIEIVKYMLEMGIDVDCHLEELEIDELYDIVLHIIPCSPLIASAESGHTDIIKLLLSGQIGRKADVHICEEEALIRSAQNNQIEAVKILLEAGADVHAQEDEALILSVGGGYTKVVELLLDNGADIHARGDQALIVSILKNFKETTDLLLNRGANINILYIELERDDPDIVEFIQNILWNLE